MLEGRCVFWPCWSPKLWGWLTGTLWPADLNPPRSSSQLGLSASRKQVPSYWSFRPRHLHKGTSAVYCLQPFTSLSSHPPSLLSSLPPFLLLLSLPSSLAPFLPFSIPHPLSPPHTHCAGEPSVDKEPSEEAAPNPELSTKKPAVVSLPDDMTAMHIDCGTFHTGERFSVTQTRDSVRFCEV